jgi:hypothetical protein
MQAAPAHWPSEDLHQLTTLFHRMVDDFLAYATEHEPGQPAEHKATRSAHHPRLPGRRILTCIGR